MAGHKVTAVLLKELILLRYGPRSKTKALSITKTTSFLLEQFSTNANTSTDFCEDKYQDHASDQFNKAMKLPSPVSFCLEMLIPNRHIREIPTRKMNPSKSTTT